MIDPSLYPKIVAKIPKQIRDGLVQSLTNSDRWGCRYHGAHTEDGTNWDSWVVYRDKDCVIKGSQIVSGGFVSILGVELAHVIKKARSSAL